MRPPDGTAATGAEFRRPAAVRSAVVVAVVLAGCVAVTLLVPAQIAGPVLLAAAVLIAFGSRLAAPAGLLGVLTLTVMWIPAGRYSLLGASALLPWRVVFLVALLAVFLALALDRRVRWQRSPFLLLALGFPAAGLVSTLANLPGLAQLGRVGAGVLADVQVFLIVGAFVAARQLVTSARLADWLCRLLVLSGAVVGAGAVWERLAGFNVFLNLQAVLPLRLLSAAPEVSRFGAARSLGSANHPIALSVVLVMLVPIAVFLAVHSPWPRSPVARRVLYLGATGPMLAGAFATGSRTFIVVLAVMAVVLLLVHWTVFVRVLVIGTPLALLGALASPGTVSGLLESFLSPDALVTQQYASAGGRGSGRLADLAPSLVQAQGHLPFGTGVGSRIVSGDAVNALILDDQYLSTLLESGLLGVLAMAALLIIPGIALLRRSRDGRLDAAEQHLALALACALLGYAVSAFFFDAFAFQQTVMVFFLLLAVGSWLVASTDDRPARAGLAPRPVGAATG